MIFKNIPWMKTQCVWARWQFHECESGFWNSEYPKSPVYDFPFVANNLWSRWHIPLKRQYCHTTHYKPISLKPALVWKNLYNNSSILNNKKSENEFLFFQITTPLSILIYVISVRISFVWYCCQRRSTFCHRQLGEFAKFYLALNLINRTRYHLASICHLT